MFVVFVCYTCMFVRARLCICCSIGIFVGGRFCICVAFVFSCAHVSVFVFVLVSVIVGGGPARSVNPRGRHPDYSVQTWTQK